MECAPICTLVIFSQLFALLAQENPFSETVDPVGIENGSIPDSSLTASSEWDDNHGPRRARLNIPRVGLLRGGWSSKVNDINQWIQVDLLNTHRIIGVATQGRQDYDQWVTNFKIAYSDDSVTFNTIQDTYTVPVSDKIFTGNTDQNTVVYNTFPEHIMCRYIRLLPTAWHNHVSLRMELYEEELIPTTTQMQTTTQQHPSTTVSPKSFRRSTMFRLVDNDLVIVDAYSSHTVKSVIRCSRLCLVDELCKGRTSAYWDKD